MEALQLLFFQGHILAESMFAIGARIIGSLRWLVKVGDLVKWIGYPGASHVENLITGPITAGIIIAKYQGSFELYRYDVAWGDGSIGSMLYEETIEVISANR